MDFQIQFDDLVQGLTGFDSKAQAAISLYVDTAALTLQDYMRAHAPWTNRTGQARQRLTAKGQKVADGWRIMLAHGVNYGVFLELAHEKRFAIIQPTIQAKGPEVMKGFENLIGRLK